MKRIRARGLALAVTLIMILLLVLLLGAFVQTYRSHYSITRSSEASRAARAGCESVYEYVVYRLEHDRTWGSRPFATEESDSDPPSFGGTLELTESPGTHRFRGRVPDLDVAFEAEIYSNLGDGTSAEAADVAPRNKAVCVVTASKGNTSQQARFVLGVAPLFDSAVLTRANLDVQAGSLEMRSRDPYRNFIRAEGDIHVPNILTQAKSRFLKADSSEYDRNGMLWAKGKIRSYDNQDDVRGWEVDEAIEIAAATENTGGRIVPEASSRFSIYDLQPSQLELSDNQRDVTLEPGRWNFTRVRANVTFSATYNSAVQNVDERGNAGEGAGLTEIIGERGEKRSKSISLNKDVWIDVLEYYENPDDPKPSAIYRGRNRDEDLISQVPKEHSVLHPGSKDTDPYTEHFVLAADGVKTESLTIAGYNTDELTITDALVKGSGDSKVIFDLNEQRVTATPSARVKVKGPLHITSETKKGVRDPAGRVPPPVLDLGHTGTGQNATRATIIAEGDINIKNGVTEGLGALISKGGDISIQPKDSQQVSVDASQNESGLLLYANGDINLSNPDRTADWNFKGLVYARGGFTMSGSRSEHASFEGSVVSLAENGKGITFEDCQHIEFIYNREMLDSFLEDLKGQRVQLDPVVWRE